MGFKYCVSEPSTEGFWLIALGAIAAYSGYQFIKNKLARYAEEKNPIKLMDRYFPASINFENSDPIRVSIDPESVSINKTELNDHVAAYKDPECGCRNVSTTNWFHMQTSVMWMDHYTRLNKLVQGFNKLAGLKDIPSELEKLCDSIFGPQSTKGGKVGSSDSQWRMVPIIFDKKNIPFDYFLPFPNEWTNDSNYSLQKKIFAKEQEVIKSVWALKSGIKRAMSDDTNDEEIAKSKLEYLVASVKLMDMIKLDLGNFSNYLKEVKDDMGMILISKE